MADDNYQQDPTPVLYKALEGSLRCGIAVTVVAMDTEFRCFVSKIDVDGIHFIASGAPKPKRIL